MLRTCLFSAILLLAGAAGASALTVDEILQLSRAGVSDDILVAQIDADPLAAPVSAAQVERLRRGHVSETVLRALGATARPEEPAAPVEPAESAPAVPERAASVTESQITLRNGEALVVVRNEDRRGIAFHVNTGARTIEFVETGTGTRLALGQQSAFALPYGVWTAQWRGESRNYRVSIRAGERTDLILLTIDTPEVAGVRLRVLRNGRDFGSSVLHLLNRAPVVVEAPPPTIVYEASPAFVAPQPATVVVAPAPTVVVAPAPVVYVEPQYYAPAPVYYYAPASVHCAPPAHPHGHRARWATPCHTQPAPIDYGYYGPTYWGTGHGR